MVWHVFWREAGLREYKRRGTQRLLSEALEKPLQINAKPTPIWAFGFGAACTQIFQISDNRSRSYAKYLFEFFT
jgi:hypothetical protein